MWHLRARFHQPNFRSDLNNWPKSKNYHRAASLQDRTNILFDLFEITLQLLRNMVDQLINWLIQEETLHTEWLEQLRHSQRHKCNLLPDLDGPEPFSLRLYHGWNHQKKLNLRLVWEVSLRTILISASNSEKFHRVPSFETWKKIIWRDRSIDCNL